MNIFYIIIFIILAIGGYYLFIGFNNDRPEIIQKSGFILSLSFPFFIIILLANSNQYQNQYQKCLKLEEKIINQEEVVSDTKLMIDLEKSDEKRKTLEEKYIKEKYKLNKCIKEYNKEANKYNSNYNGIFHKKLTIYHNKN